MKSRKKLIISILIIYTILYWLVLCPVVWISVRNSAKSSWFPYIFFGLAFVMFLLIAWLSVYILRKYNYFEVHSYPVQEHNKVDFVQQDVIPVSTVFANRRRSSSVDRMCEMESFDSRVLVDKATQTDEENILPKYRSSIKLEPLVLNVSSNRNSNEYSPAYSTPSTSIYSVLDEYYKNNSMKLTHRLSEVREMRQSMERTVLKRQTSSDVNFNHPPIDTKIIATDPSVINKFLENEKAYCSFRT